MPFWGPKHPDFKAPIEHGQTVRGAVAAFKLEEQGGKVRLAPAWVSRDMNQADHAVIANGVVFAFGNGVDATQSDVVIGLAYNDWQNRPQGVDARRAARLRRADRRGAVVERRTRSRRSTTSPACRWPTAASTSARTTARSTRSASTSPAPPRSRRHVDREGRGDQVMRLPLPLRHVRSSLALTAGLAALPALAAAQAREVTTAGFDAQRTNWVRTDVRINRDSVGDGSFTFLWKHKYPGDTRQLESLTQPVLLDFLVGYVGFKSLAFFGGADDVLYAIDTDLAKPYWTTHLTSMAAVGSTPGSTWHVPRRPVRGAEPGHAARADRRSAASAAAAAAPPAPSANRARAPPR